MSAPRAALLVGVGLVVVVALVWVPPAVAGPTIACGEFDQATCDELLPDVITKAKAQLGLTGLVFPMTAVAVSGTADCVSYEVMLLFGIVGVVGICN